MRTRRDSILLVTAAFMIHLGTATRLCAEPQSSAPADSKWEKEIQAFEQWDQKNSFPADAVLFIGSSSIRMWPTRTCFPDLPVINRGFGGSQIAEVSQFVPRILFPYDPRAIVFYAGDNDIAAGKSPRTILSDYQEFVRRVREKLDDAPIYFLAIKPSASRWSMWINASEANNLIRDFCRQNPGLFYVDTATCLLAENGSPNPIFYLKDDLHLNAQGYRLWTEILHPLLVPKITPADKSVNNSVSGSAMPSVRSAESAPVESPTGYFAAKSSKIFHRAGCSFLNRISEENRISFASRDQAASSGRRPCKTCNP